MDLKSTVAGTVGGTTLGVGIGSKKGFTLGIKMGFITGIAIGVLGTSLLVFGKDKIKEKDLASTKKQA